MLKRCWLSGCVPVSNYEIINKNIQMLDIKNEIFGKRKNIRSINSCAPELPLVTITLI